MIPTDAMEKAIIDWVKAGTGLSAVKWADDPKVQGLARPWVDVGRLSLEPIGTDGLLREDNILEFDAFEFVADETTNELTAVAHGLANGDGPVQLTTSGTLPAGLELATDYWVIRVDDDTLKLAASHRDAVALTAVDFSDAGTGTHELEATSETVPHGAELVETVLGDRRGRILLQCIAAESVGATAAVPYLNRLMTRTKLESVRAILTAQKISVLRFGRVTPVGSQAWGLFEPRAVLEVVLGLVDQESETQTIITSTTVEVEDTGITIEADAEA